MSQRPSATVRFSRQYQSQRAGCNCSWLIGRKSATIDAATSADVIVKEMEAPILSGRFGLDRRLTVLFLTLFSMLTAMCLTTALVANGDRGKRNVTDLSEKELHRFFPELAGLKAADAQTDLPMILQKVGDNESALLRNLPNLTAREEVVQQQMHSDIGGTIRPVPFFSGKYNYLVLAHQQSDGVRLVEYRTDLKGKEIRPGADRAAGLTLGFALIPLLFHPFHQAAATFRYLGRQVVDHSDMYVVAFAQQPDRAQLTGQVQLGARMIPTSYQGIAWIDPARFEIVRMRTDLLEPRPDLGLFAQTTEAHFMEIHVATVTTPLWMPRSVVVSTLTTDWGLRTHHSYSNYQRFAATSRILPR